MLTFDASDFAALGRGLDRAAASDLIGKIEPTIMHGAGNLQRGMQDDLGQSSSFAVVSRAVTFDIDRFQQHIRAEVGPTSAGQQLGDLAAVAYFGGDSRFRGGGGTVQDPEYLLEKEAPNLEEHVGDVLDNLLDLL